MSIFRKHDINKRNKTQLSLCLFLIASPWIVLFFTTIIIAHQSVFHSVPCWSDELAYWHEILSFSQKGFYFGYYSMNEIIPTYLSFGTHGLGAVSVYALFGKIFGWNAYSLVVANSFFVSLAFLFLTFLIKISTKNLLIILAFTLTYTPFLLFSSTSMTELLNYSVMIVYVGMLHVYLLRGSKNWLLVLVLFCTAISFIRIIYIILFLPLLFKRKDEFKFDSKFVIFSFLWLVFSVFLFVLSSKFVSPYPESFINELFNSSSFKDFVDNFVTHFIENSWYLINPVSENIIQVLQRYFLLSVIILSLVKSNIIQSKFRKIDINYFSVFIILFLFLLINIAAYDVFDWRDYRVLAPVLFGCILFLILKEKKPVVYGTLFFNVMGVLFLIISPQIMDSFNKDRYTEPKINSLLRQIEYTAPPVSRFENTIVIQQYTTNTVLNIPAGIGISYSKILSDKLKSKYIFTDKKQLFVTYKLINSNETGYLYQKIKDSRQKTIDFRQ